MQDRKGRQGDVFGLRLTPDERSELESYRMLSAGPDALGPWLVWAARESFQRRVLPGQVHAVMPTRAGRLLPNRERRVAQDNASKLILDLCGGSGSWAKPYEDAGYAVVRVELSEGGDVHTMGVLDLLPTPADPAGVHGILAAPPCTEFSLAKNGQERDIRAGLETVSACLRIVYACAPQWWALENPVGLLSTYLGTPTDNWEPYEFGDPWTKRTAIWGDFAKPERGPYVEPRGSAMTRSGAAARAVTPPGFARAFFEANP